MAEALMQYEEVAGFMHAAPSGQPPPSQPPSPPASEAGDDDTGAVSGEDAPTSADAPLTVHACCACGGGPNASGSEFCTVCGIRHHWCAHALVKLRCAHALMKQGLSTNMCTSSP